MKYSYTIFLTTLLGGAAFAANSKLNQYASLDDCAHDRNIISHASPAESTCHKVDSRTKALYLVVGSGAAGATFWGHKDDCCKGDVLNVPHGSCIAAPDGLKTIMFGLSDSEAWCP